MNTRVQRVVLTYKKHNAARWLSHLDLIRTLERAIRRAQTPVTYSEGFNPRPRLSFGPPLPLGATSDAEILALRLDQPVEPLELLKRLNAQLPSGIEISDARVLADSEPTLQAIHGCEYLIRATCRIENAEQTVAQCIKEFLSQNEVIAQRVDKRLTKRVNIRPSVESLEVVEAAGGIVILRARLSHENPQIAKPSELIEALSHGGCELRLVSIHRRLFY